MTGRPMNGRYRAVDDRQCDDLIAILRRLAARPPQEREACLGCGHEVPSDQPCPWCRSARERAL